MYFAKVFLDKEFNKCPEQTKLFKKDPDYSYITLNYYGSSPLVIYNNLLSETPFKIQRANVIYA